MAKHIKRIVRSQSSRNGTKPNRVVLHTTEGHNRPGISDLEGLAAYFNGVEASSHLAVDAEGNSCRMVEDHKKAWTQANYNPGSLSIEQIGFASTTTKEWVKNYHGGLIRVAHALTHWALKYPNIQLRRAVEGGVCAHADLGAAGGGHHDPGVGYPWQYVIWLARLHYYRHKKWNTPKNPVRWVKYQAYLRYVHSVEKRYAGRILT